MVFTILTIAHLLLVAGLAGELLLRTMAAIPLTKGGRAQAVAGAYARERLEALAIITAG